MSGAPSRWIPLESNPDVLNEWSRKAGLVESQGLFVDVYGLDSDLLGMVPKPVQAVVLLFPITPEIEAKKRQEDEKIKNGSQHPVDPTVFWMKQTIGNACGTIGLIHALANSHSTFVPGSPLALFIQECKDETPEERAKILETTELFASIHADVATTGQTTAPDANEHVDLHFTAFVQAPDPPRGDVVSESKMRLLELDGRRIGPVDRGESTDLLEDVAKYVKENLLGNTSSMQFSMMALAPHDY